MYNVRRVDTYFSRRHRTHTPTNRLYAFYTANTKVRSCNTIDKHTNVWYNAKKAPTYYNIAKKYERNNID